MSATVTFESLVADAERASVDGWDFGWLDGRATEERPPWGYADALAERLGRVDAALDLDTGGGEVLDRAPVLPTLTVATESWPPNLARAAARLGPRGVAVVSVADGAPLPFADATFDLVSSRHPVVPPWAEIARVLRPGGRYFAQHVGPASVFDLIEEFLGPLPEPIRRRRHPDDEVAAAEEAGLSLVDLRTATLRLEFLDIGAIVWFLRKVVWLVPGFTAERYRDQLLALQERIETEGVVVAHSTRTLLELEKD